MTEDLRQRCIDTLVERFLIDDESAAPLADAVLDTIGAETLADETLLRGLIVDKGGVNLELIPPREIAAVWVHAAIGMLGDAPNYTETRVDFPKVSLEISPAGSFDRYALIVQRVGKLTPHEARLAAEERAERAEAELASAQARIDRVQALHQPEEPPPGHEWVSGGRTPLCQGCSTGDPFDSPPWPCDTIRALDGTLGEV